MFSRILIKLIDESIVPAVLLLVTRLVSVVGVARLNHVPFDFGATGLAFKSADDYIFVNSYSMFYMVVVITIGLFYVLTKSLLFHGSHIKPKISAKLSEYNLRSVIQNSYQLYTQGSIWLSYCFLLLLVAGFMMFFNYLYPWVFYVSLVLSVVSTILFIADVEEELIIMKRNSPLFDEMDGKVDFDDLEDEE